MVENDARVQLAMAESENINLKMEAYTIIGDADAIYKQGYEEGFAKGEETGFDKGYADGKEDGLTEGEDIGYNKGYDEGEAFGKENAPTDDLSVTLTSNGTFNYPKPNDKYYADVEVTVNVPSDKMPTQEKSITITKNGSEVISPDAGHVLDKVTVVTDIDTRLPEQYKSLEVTENKVYEVTPDDGYTLSKVTVTGNVAGSSEEAQVFRVTMLSPENWYYTTSSDWLYSNIASIEWLSSDIQMSKLSFGGFLNMKSCDLSRLDISSFTSFAGMFTNCRALTDIAFQNWDTSKITSFASMFSNCYALQTLNLSSFNTTNVIDMSYMFSNCYALQTLDLSNFNTTKITNMGSMLANCYALHTLNLSSFDTANVTNMYVMFNYAQKLANVTFASNWASHSSITSFEMKQSPLSKASILDLANKIADKSDKTIYTSTYTVKLKSSQKSLFTEDELTALANQFTAKNWTLAWS